MSRPDEAKPSVCGDQPVPPPGFPGVPEVHPPVIARTPTGRDVFLGRGTRADVVKAMADGIELPEPVNEQKPIPGTLADFLASRTTLVNPPSEPE